MYYVDKSGQVVASDDDPEQLAAAGYTPATDHDIDRHNSDLDYEDKGLAGKAAETIGTGVKSAIRGAEAGLDAIGLDTGVSRDEQGNPYSSPGAANEGLFGGEAQLEAERHPFAAGAGQAALTAPLGIGAGVAAAGLGAGALGVGAAGVAAESAAGGYASESENAWVQDRDFSQEAALTNVAAGLLVGGGVMGAGALAVAGVRGAQRLGRNLLTEAEHASSARAARDLLDGAPTGKRGGKGPGTADEVAQRGGDDAGVAYLRDHADELTDEIATKQAKAAQELLDTYGEMAPLRQSREQVDELIPDSPVEQARWVSQTRRQVLEALDGVPDDVAAPVRERLATLGDGSDPSRWFTEASEASDELLRAGSKARRSGLDAPPDLSGAGSADDVLLQSTPQRVPVSEQIAGAKRLLDEGLRDEGLWGSAGKFERQRAAGYARRYGEHIDDFESSFTAGGKTDPAAFRRVIAGEGDPAAIRALDATLDSARATADVAEQFGRKAEAARIRGAIDVLQRTSRQGQVVAAAKAAVARETKSATQSALEWLSREGARTIGDEAVDYAVNVATGGLIPRFARNAVGGAVKRMVKGRGSAVADGLSEAAQGALGRMRARAGQEGYTSLGRNSRLPAGGEERAVSLAMMDAKIRRLPRANLDELPSTGMGSYPRQKMLAQMETMTAEERRAVMVDYVGEDFQDMRATIHGEEGFHHPAVEAFERGLQKLSVDNPTSSGPLYRGIKVDDDAINEALLSGEFNTSAPSSTSYNAQEAASFASDRLKPGQRALIIRFDKVDNGALVNPFEHEVIIPKGGHFRVKDRTRLDDGSLMITVEQIGKASDDDMARLGALGSVGLADGPNFSLGDVARSPMGAVTGVGAGAVGARELYLAQRDEQREGTFAAVVGLAQTARASLGRAVNSLLSRSSEDPDGDRVRIDPPKPPVVTLDNYDATRDHLERMVVDPVYFGDVMAASFGSMPTAAPEVFAAMSAEAAKTAQYLLAIAPGGKSGGPFAQSFPVGEDEVWEFNERMRAVSDPDFVPDELARGAVSAQAMEAYEMMRPRHYAHLQRTVFERLQELAEQGIPVTIQAREQIDTMLNIDGGGDPALTWKVAERAYAAIARKNEISRVNPGGGDTEEHEQSMTSGALSTLHNGASAIAQTG